MVIRLNDEGSLVTVLEFWDRVTEVEMVGWRHVERVVSKDFFSGSTDSARSDTTDFPGLVPGATSRS